MAAKGTTKMEVGGDGVAVITICNPPVNSLSIDVLLSLKESYEEALQRKDVKAIVVTGTQRLPRLVGLTKSLEMVLLSKPIKGEEAHQLGLVDALVSPNDLVNTARRLALDICELRKPWIKSLYKTHKLEPLGGDSQVCKGSSSKAGCKS